MSFIEIDELVKKLRVPKETIYQWTSRKKIPYYKIGKTLKFEESEIDKWLKERRVAPMK